MMCNVFVWSPDDDGDGDPPKGMLGGGTQRVIFNVDHIHYMIDGPDTVIRR